ncbi:DegT/DnrJ/EryC1/StrS family aminotransferase [Roseimaritima sediminicola]|uniref:DegT/DnrJ/EryC1/StrS family aminotransferase n=1 Tax=Roseimaritima sediminicola TaxID=2662066 RepID=UPI001298364C|nr:DegT/DnrJ/EryC1/StrS family aminotransferase [Roseimaritima sediminicola]
MIPLCDLKQQYTELQAELEAALLSSAAAGQYIMGPNVRGFEQEFAAYADCKYAIGVGNGTDALHISLLAAGIGPGDEVITTPFTFIATCEAINLVGATPVFVDIDPVTFNIDPDKIEEAITPRTKLILPVHLYGLPCEMDRILAIAEQHHLKVIEDCAQSVGASYKGKQTGTMGLAGCLSFFPSKNLGCMGDGGMILTNDDEMYERAEMLRRHGGKVKYHHTENGVNSRLDDIQAAVLRVKLSHLEQWNQRRQAAAAKYAEGLADQPISLPTAGNSDALSVFHQYTVLVDGRDRLLKVLGEQGVGTAVYYPIPLHLQEVNRSLNYQPGDFPVSERVADRCLSLPMSPHLTPEQQEVVCHTMIANLEPVGTQG